MTGLHAFVFAGVGIPLHSIDVPKIGQHFAGSGHVLYGETPVKDPIMSQILKDPDIVLSEGSSSSGKLILLK
jgi:hypothetical protein